MPRSLLLHAFLAAASLALRMPSEGDVDPALQDDVDPALLAKDEEDLQKIIPIDQYQELWTQRYSSERHLWEPMPSSIQLVLGLFTVAPDIEYREVVRRTWFNQTGVCYLQRKPQKGCSVYVAFVIGKEGIGEHYHGSHSAHMSAKEVEATHREKGMFVLNMAENMNGGKSMLWFDTARRLFPWATHMGKMDLDAYPLLHKLVHRMEAGKECSLRHGPYEVIARPWASKQPAPNPPGFACGGEACPEFEGVGTGWQFLAGELYVLSMPLVQQVAWLPSHHGNEDIVATQLMGAAAWKGGFCVVMRRLDAWYHRSHESDAKYNNDL